jgi:hypothetical protein
MLHEHRVLTTHAIAHMAFPSDHRARRRLLQLQRWDVLDRFAPRLPLGAAPWHYVLGHTGAAALAAHHGLSLRALGYRRDAALAIAHHHTLAHTVAVNDLFAHLIHHSTRPGARMRLDTWWSETRCRRYLDHIHPDAYARTTHPANTNTSAEVGSESAAGVGVFEWFLELDLATTTLATLTAKLVGYAQLGATTRPRPILFWFPTSSREAHARRRLAHAINDLGPQLLPIATGTAAIAARARTDPPPAAPGPADKTWLPLTRRPVTDRGDLADLARLWPATPGATLADDADTGHDTTLDPTSEVGDELAASAWDLPAPPPIPPPIRPDPTVDVLELRRR